MNEFVPPFCANPRCPHHLHTPQNPYRDYLRWGSYRSRVNGEVPRYRCRVCGKTFSRQTFRVDYWVKRRIGYAGVMERLASCSSVRAMGRVYGVAGQTIQNRIGRGARQVLAFESRQGVLRHPEEDVVADGFESYCGSQYFPNNIQLLVGSRSQFVYEVEYAGLRRKGRMTERQKARRAELEQRYLPERGELGTTFVRLLETGLSILSDGGMAGLTLWTDEKLEYRRALRGCELGAALEDAGRLVHRRIPSRRARTVHNPLFPVNYLDRELRKDLHEHVRESTCFGRNVNAQMERLVLYLYYHNYRKPHRARGDPRSHAELAGSCMEAVHEDEKRLWEDRAWLSRTELSPSGRETWLRLRRTPLKEGPEHAPRYVAA